MLGAPFLNNTFFAFLDRQTLLRVNREVDAAGVRSIIHAAPRTDTKEVQQRRQLPEEKDGKDFALQAMENSNGKVAEVTFKKLRVEPPDPELVIYDWLSQYLYSLV